MPRWSIDMGRWQRQGFVEEMPSGAELPDRGPLRSRMYHRQETSSFCPFFIFTTVLRIELRALHMTGEHSTTELHSQSIFLKKKKKKSQEPVKIAQ